MRKLFLLIIVLVIASCEHTEMNIDELGLNTTIIGTWVEAELNDSFVETHVLQRSQELAQDKYGFIISEDGSFTERKNSGWCGTPPISYGNFDGEWVALSDSVLAITVGYWGGIMTYEMNIVSLEGDLLVVDFIFDTGGE